MQAAKEQLAVAALAALQRHPPFDEMEAASLGWLAARLELGYYARGSTIAGPATAAPRFHVIRSGRVRGPEAILGEGECFPVDALLARSAPAADWQAEEDSFCWELAGPAFHELLDRSPRFRAFCTDRLSLMLAQSRRLLRAEAAHAVHDDAGMLAPLRSVLTRAPVSCLADAPLGEALQAMQSSRVGSIVVVDGAGLPVGIFTTSDLISRVTLPQADLRTPVREVMTRDPVTLEDDAPLVDAAVSMVRHGFRHIVLTRDGRLSGVVSERDLFSLQRSNLRRTAERIGAAHTVAQLADVAADVRQLGTRLLAHGVGAEHLVRILGTLNDLLSRRVVELVAERRAVVGKWCWLALGSEGRLEQTFATDQDNALLFDAEGPADAVRGGYLAFADEVNRGLDACGFPLCKGDIMARNPRWCLSLSEWQGVFDGWIRNTDPQALLGAAIFFDFRALAGDAALAGALRGKVLEQARASPAFCRAMAHSALQVRPPLGVLRDFVADDPDAPPGTLDLKRFGARLFTDAARVLALAGALEETGTAARLHAAARAGALPSTEAAAMADAFHFIQSLRLRKQALGGHAPGEENRIRPQELNTIDRRMLKEALLQAGLLQQRLELEYPS
jgi:CBS domain-containing protein